MRSTAVALIAIAIFSVVAGKGVAVWLDHALASMTPIDGAQ